MRRHFGFRVWKQARERLLVRPSICEVAEVRFECVREGAEEKGRGSETAAPSNAPASHHEPRPKTSSIILTAILDLAGAFF